VSSPTARDLGTGDLDEFRRAGHAIVDAVADHLAALPGRPVWQPLPDDLRAELLSLPLPDRPSALDPLAATMTRDVLPYAMGNGHPAFFGWVNPPPSLAGVLASLIAAAMNPSVVSGDHADVHLERTTVRWLAELVGYPHEPGAGLLTSGASAATIVCLAGARGRAATAAGRDVRRDGLAGGPPLLSYVPAETHSCVPRAIELLGLGSESIRPVPLPGGRLDGDALRATIAGRFRGMERADSLTLDPHKWLGVPVDAGCACVRRGDNLREAFSTVPPYLRQDTGAEVGTFAEYGLEQTRPFRALKTWATIAARGRDGIVDQVVRANSLARELASMVEREPSLELAAPPETSIVAFRARPSGCGADRLEAVNRALPEAIQARGRAFVTGTVYQGRETMRACILHPGTTKSDLETLVAEVVAAADELAAA
jgi:glutamate/tyrosine decarboxylase-like PLP-dependent enzyme